MTVIASLASNRGLARRTASRRRPRPPIPATSMVMCALVVLVVAAVAQNQSGKSKDATCARGSSVLGLCRRPADGDILTLDDMVSIAAYTASLHP